MFSVVLRFILCDQSVQCSQHVGKEAIEVGLDRIGKDASLVVHQMCEVDVKSGELELAEAVDLCDVIFVGRDCA